MIVVMQIKDKSIYKRFEIYASSLSRLADGIRIHKLENRKS